MKKLTALLMVVMLLVGCVNTVFAADYTHVTKTPPTEIPTWEYDNCNECKESGYYETTITYNTDKTRFFAFYYAEHLEYNCAQLYVTVPDGYDPYEFIVDSGWKQIADDYGTIIALMVADGEWGNWEEDGGYIEAVYAFVSAKPYLAIRKHNDYMVCYDGAGMGAKWAYTHPTQIAAVLDVDSLGVTDELVNLYANTPSGFFSWETAESLSCTEMEYPTWIVASEITPEIEAQIAMVKAMNKSVDEAQVVSERTTYYAPDASKYVELPEYEAVSDLYVTVASAADVINYEFSEKVWNSIFYPIRRNRSYGEVRSYVNPDDEGNNYTRYEALVYSGDYTDAEGNTRGQYFNRYWHVYVPDGVKDLDKASVLFVVHGGGGSTNEAVEACNADALADAHNIILVMPQGSVNWGTSMKTTSGISYYTLGTSWYDQASEVHSFDPLFIDYLMNWLGTDFEYADKVDFSRVFFTGQSMGGLMSAFMTIYRPYYFAGIAPCSAFQEVVTKPLDESVDVPVFNLIGGCDSSNAGGWTNTRMGNPPAVFSYFQNRYNITESNGMGRNYEDFEFQAATPEKLTYKKDMLNIYSYSTAKGYPMFEAIEAVGMCHATNPSFLFYFYDTVMSHYTRDPETLVLYYDGEVVDTPVNMELYNNIK